MAKKKKQTASQDKCIKDMLLILAKSGMPAPGSDDGVTTYVMKLNRKGVVEGVDVHFSNAVVGKAGR
jgi:hypothetical protein